MNDRKLSGISLLLQILTASGVACLCRALPEQELTLREIPGVWIAAVVLFALFTAAESYFVLTRFLIDMRRLFSLQGQKIYFAVLMNIAVFLLLSGGIMLCFANQKGAILCTIGFISLSAGLGFSLGTMKNLRQHEE